MRHPVEYDAKVKGKRNESARAVRELMETVLEYVQRFATKEAADAAAGKTGDEEEDQDEEMSDVGSISDEEP
jgi:ubiquitin-conjugating enzyme E2 H